MQAFGYWDAAVEQEIRSRLETEWEPQLVGPSRPGDTEKRRVAARRNCCGSRAAA